MQWRRSTPSRQILTRREFSYRLYPQAESFHPGRPARIASAWHGPRPGTGLPVTWEDEMGRMRLWHPGIGRKTR